MVVGPVSILLDRKGSEERLSSFNESMGEKNKSQNSANTHERGIVSGLKTTSDLLTFKSEWWLVTGSLVIRNRDIYIYIYIYI